MTAGTNPIHGRPDRRFDRRTMLRSALLGAAGVAAAGTASGLVLPQGARADEIIRGQDVSSHQENVDWKAQKEAGSSFAYCKATQGSNYTNPFFAQQYGGSYDAGLVHGPYHWTEPGNSDSPEAECDFFLDNGGGWTDDGRTMPGMLDVEDNPNGLGQADMQAWITGWINHYRKQTGRTPVVYTGAWFWDDQVGPNWAPANVPLHVAHYKASAPVGTEIPGTWNHWEIWQHADSGPFAGDQNAWYGSKDRWESFLTDKDYDPVSN